MDYRRIRLAVVLTGVFAARLVTAQTAQAPTPPGTQAVMWSTLDGRRVFEILTEREGRGWVANVPRIPGWRRPQGVLEVFAVQFRRSLENGRPRVKVSVLSPRMEVETPVADVFLTLNADFTVDRLREFGVEPITLSLVEVRPLAATLPNVVSRSSDIEISSVELTTSPYPGYRVTLRNLSSRSAASYEVQTYRGGVKGVSASPRGTAGRPVMAPGGSHTFTLNLASGSVPIGESIPIGGVSPVPFDVIEINAVLWEDGSHDGAPRFPWMGASLATDAGRALQLERIVTLFKGTLQNAGDAQTLLWELRQGLMNLAVSEPNQLAQAQASMQAVRDSALVALQRFEMSQPGTDGVRQWMRQTIDRDEASIRLLRGESAPPAAPGTVRPR